MVILDIKHIFIIGEVYDILDYSNENMSEEEKDKLWTRFCKLQVFS